MKHIITNRIRTYRNFIELDLAYKFRNKFVDCLLTKGYVIHKYGILINNNEIGYDFVLRLNFVQINVEKKMPKTSMNLIIFEIVLPNERACLLPNDRERLSQDKRNVNFSMKIEGFKIERSKPSQNPFGMNDTDSMR